MTISGFPSGVASGTGAPNAAKGYPEFPRKIFQASGVPISTPKFPRG
jgi:hypothetical protein